MAQHDHLTKTFSEAWKAFQWKPTIWVHWVCAHSTFFIARSRTLYIFSSVPTEKRHQYFKLDPKHCFHGWRLSKTVLHHRGLAQLTCPPLTKGLNCVNCASQVHHSSSAYGGDVILCAMLQAIYHAKQCFVVNVC